MFSLPWSVVLCLHMALSSLPLVKSLQCSAALVRAEQEPSPSYTFEIPWSSHISQTNLYPTFLEMHGILFWFLKSFLQIMYFFMLQFSGGNEFSTQRISLICTPPTSMNFILCLLFISISCLVSSFTNIPPSVTEQIEQMCTSFPVCLFFTSYLFFPFYSVFFLL